MNRRKLTESSDSKTDFYAKNQKAGIALVSAAVSAFGSGILGIYILVWIWEADDSAILGLIPGLFAGVVVGIGWSRNLLSKNYSSLKVIIYSLLAALFISGFFVIIYTLITIGKP